MGALGLCLGLRQRGLFGPRQLFARGEAGAWYDPADLASMFQDNAGTIAAAVGAPVGLIRDKSGRGNDAVQATAGARPLLKQDSGGRYYLEFDGVDDRLSAVFPIAQPFDRISAVRQIAWQSGGVIFGNSTAGDHGILYQGASAGTITMRSNSLTLSRSNVAIGVTNVVGEHFDGSGSTIFVNNEAASAGAIGTLAPGGIALGARGSGTGPSSIRIYGMCMVGRSLLSGETGRLRRFMAARGGVAI